MLLVNQLLREKTGTLQTFPLIVTKQFVLTVSLL